MNINAPIPVLKHPMHLVRHVTLHKPGCLAVTPCLSRSGFKKNGCRIVLEQLGHSLITCFNVSATIGRILESSCCRLEAWAISFTPRCLNSLRCINEYLAIDSGGYVIEYYSRSNCSVAECFPDKSSWC